jgi:hypothetical protein
MERAVENRESPHLWQGESFGAAEGGLELNTIEIELQRIEETKVQSFDSLFLGS